ncbi:MAG TPA: universal stress protein [Candidatus Treponema faecavium]|nr:universal stress protein [Candidatus Treponema faecavium]
MIKSLFQNVLILVNGSESSIHAVQYGILMAKLYRCNLKAVYVVDTATLKQLTLSKFFVADESRSFEESLTRDGRRYLDYAVNLGKAKNIKIETELLSGSVGYEVIAAAERMHAGLILLGSCSSVTKNTAAVKHDAVSSSNQEILRSARCSVLVVKEENIEQLYKMG